MIQQLKETIAAYLNTDPTLITDDFIFSGKPFQSSVGMMRFLAFAEKKMKLSLPKIKSGMKLSDITKSPATFNQTNQPIKYSTDPGLGIDSENIESLPDTSDYRSHEFYTSHFTPEEITYCILQPNPKHSFCGLLCAKEALMKSHPNFISLKANEIEVSHDEFGKPYYKNAGEFKKPQYSLSISHTNSNAVAISTPLLKNSLELTPEVVIQSKHHTNKTWNWVYLLLFIVNLATQFYIIYLLSH